MPIQGSLVKELQKVAARKMRNTRGIPKTMAGKVELIEIAFGRAEVLDDFEKWCDENADRAPQYPVSDYIRIIDSRLGARPSVDPHDERINTLQSFIYEQTDILPRASGVREALAFYSQEDIKTAFQEFWLVNEGAEKIIAGRQTLVREFFEDGGVSAIIAARKRRK